MRHDRIGIAAIRRMMLQQVMHFAVTTDEVDQKHPRDRIAAELVQRGESFTRSFGHNGKTNPWKGTSVGGAAKPPLQPGGDLPQVRSGESDRANRVMHTDSNRKPEGNAYQNKE